MDGFGSNQRTLAVEQWMEIVNGKGYGVNGSTTQTRSNSSDFLPYIPPPPGAATAVHSSAPSPAPWRFLDPETRRKKRIATYKAYGMEAKVKSTVKKGFHWFKKILHG